jgi:hypothetical protein
MGTTTWVKVERQMRSIVRKRGVPQKVMEKGGMEIKSATFMLRRARRRGVKEGRMKLRSSKRGWVKECRMT